MHSCFRMWRVSMEPEVNCHKNCSELCGYTLNMTRSAYSHVPIPYFQYYFYFVFFKALYLIQNNEVEIIKWWKGTATHGQFTQFMVITNKPEYCTTLKGVTSCCLFSTGRQRFFFSSELQRPPPPIVGKVTHYSVEMYWEDALAECNKQTKKGDGRIRVCVQEEDRNGGWGNVYTYVYAFISPTIFFISRLLI